MHRKFRWFWNYLGAYWHRRAHESALQSDFCSWLRSSRCSTTQIDIGWSCLSPGNIRQCASHKRWKATAWVLCWHSAWTMNQSQYAMRPTVSITRIRHRHCLWYDVPTGFSYILSPTAQLWSRYIICNTWHRSLLHHWTWRGTRPTIALLLIWQLRRYVYGILKFAYISMVNCA